MIIVADDFGASDGANRAIKQALEQGLVTATSVISNGAGFDEAAELARANRRLADRIGVHLVLTEGEPVTNPIRRLPRFCDPDGRYRLWRGSERAIRLTPDERHAVTAELRAQVDRVRAAGLIPSHLDSHHHVHTEPGIAGIVISLAREQGVPRVRLARNCGSDIGPVNRAWKSHLNARLNRAGLAGTRWFGSLDDYLRLKATGADASSFEVMMHPVLATDGELEDADAPGVPLVLGAALRFATLGAQSDRYDEAVAAMLMRKSFVGMLGTLPHMESTPPPM